MAHSLQAETLQQAASDLFDCVLVINLPERNDRRVQMERELRKIGLSLQDGTASIQVARRFSEPAGFETIGARGCFDSHLQAMKTAVAQGARNLLIFEDDCDFAKNITSQWPAVLHHLENRAWSLFYGGHLSTLDDNSCDDDLYRIEPEIGLMGSHFIGISGQILPVLIAYFEAMLQREPGSPAGGPMHVDGAYSWFRRNHPELETWIASPQLGSQRPSRSDVHDLSFFDRMAGLRQIAGVARSVKRRLVSFSW